MPELIFAGGLQTCAGWVWVRAGLPQSRVGDSSQSIEAIFEASLQRRVWRSLVAVGNLGGTLRVDDALLTIYCRGNRHISGRRGRCHAALGDLGRVLSVCEALLVCGAEGGVTASHLLLCILSIHEAVQVDVDKRLEWWAAAIGDLGRVLSVGEAFVEGGAECGAFAVSDLGCILTATGRWRGHQGETHGKSTGLGRLRGRTH